MMNVEKLRQAIEKNFANKICSAAIALNELTIEVDKKNIREICLALRDHPEFKFEQLMDVCGVDYLEYGLSEWQTYETTTTGFERAVNEKIKESVITWNKPRFAVVYHLLSLTHNHRVRIKSFLEEKDLAIDSVVNIWLSANWFEREAFDLYGILFHGHPDLRRLLTDYGFVGHPFRKDFPLIGNVEMRYDAKLERCIYEPVSIQPRVLAPKVIRASKEI